MSVELTANGLSIAGQSVPVYSGSLHYWHLERELWPRILDQVLDLGFKVVETYIPWAIHETSPGHYDWGQQDPRKDFEGFARLCEEKGLWLIVRPGPLINAELTNFGFPAWILADPAMQARTALGTPHLDAAWGLHPPHPFPVPSYASEAFYQAVGKWFDAICPIISRHLAPEGCIISVQSDNETCYLFHDQPYATDYSPASLELYRRFLAERYEQDINKLNRLYPAPFASFEEVQPPRDCEVSGPADVQWHLDWVAYKEYQIRYSVGRCAAMLRERGIAGVPIFHDIAFQYSTPLDVARLETTPGLDWVGMNLYRNQESYRGAIQEIRFLAGSTRLPFVPEFGSGIWSHHPRTPRPAEQEFITLSALMYGLKAINFYMLVERDRWQGSPITRQGNLRPEYAEFYRHLNDFLQRYRFWEFHRQPQTLVLLNYDLGRYCAMASTLNYAHADLYGLPRELFEVDLELGLRWPALVEGNPRSSDNWLGRLTGWLDSHFIDYNLSDSHITPEQLAGYPLVYLQATDFMDVADQEQFLDYVRQGGHLVVGPGLPYLDPALLPVSGLGDLLKQPGMVKLGAGQLSWVGEEPGRLEDWLGQQYVAKLPPFWCDNPAVDLTLHRSGDSDLTLLFVANPRPQPVKTALYFEGTRRLKAAWGAEQVLNGTSQVELNLAAYSVQIWEVAKTDD